MRLINAKTLELEKFDGIPHRPPYAILSHRWVDGQEVEFEDMQRAHRQWMPGWSKIQFCCRQALADGLKYAWVDTCCIDKSSSAELSEAINSMFDWYADAQCCYAYLNDVSRLSGEVSDIASQIVRSTWFTRAWTLQELIAPNEVIFYDRSFCRLGSKHDFADQIEQSANIPTAVLSEPTKLFGYPVAVRMSWAAHRDATRPEDIAYSLFGLFEVNLPLLYGEGSRAFMRLQEEIIRQSHDHSIFVWKSRTMRDEFEEFSSGRLPLLASSPAHFENCRDIVTLEDDEEIRPYSMTNVGLQIELQVFPYDLDTYVALLDCGPALSQRRHGILLARESEKSSRWFRAQVKGCDIVTIDPDDNGKSFVWRKMYIVKSSQGSDLHRENTYSTHPPYYGIKIDAASFLMYNGATARPYALVAHHDWEVPPKIRLMENNNEALQPEYTAHIDNRSRPLSLMDHANANGQSTALTGYFAATIRALEERTTSLSVDTPQPLAKISQENVDKHARVFSKVEESLRPIGTFEMPLMTSGTAGVVFFDYPVHGIKSIKVGFDFAFHPVMFIATHEADTDPQVQRWMQQRRFEPLEQFERTHYLLDDFHEEGARQFWKLQPDMLNTNKNAETLQDGSVRVHKGVYAFTSRDSSRPDHWIFKPFEAQDWHIALGLEKCARNGTTSWEFTMDKRQDAVRLNFMLT